MSAVCLVVSNLAHASTEDDLSTIFSNYSLIQGQVREDGTQCIGFVFLQSLEEAKRAIKDLDRSFYDSRRIRVVLLSDYEKEQQRGISQSGSDRPSKRRKHNNDADANRTDLTNLYVCPIPAGTSEATLLQLFSQYGRVRKATILHRHRGGKSVAGKPGFVNFNQNADARKCISSMHGRPLSQFFIGAPSDLVLTVRFSDSHSKNDPNNKKKAQVQLQPETKKPVHSETLTYPDNRETFANTGTEETPNFDSEPTAREKQLLSLLENEKKKYQQLLEQLNLCQFCSTKNQHLLSRHRPDSHFSDFTTRTMHMSTPS